MKQIIAVCMFLVTGVALAAGPSVETHYALRGYREFTGSDQVVGDQKPVEVRSFVFESPERASIFASKIYSDYQETIGNVLTTINTAKGPVDVISLQGTDFILPLIERDGKKVTVLIGQDQGALKTQADALLTNTPLRAAEVKHPQFMDKWDQYCMGVWNRISDLREDPTHKTPESYYGWLAKIGLNPQIVGSSDSQDLTANDNQLRWIRKYFTAADTHYQNVEWLQAYPDLYNRNPFLSSFDGPGMMTPWSYYGETPHAPGLLRDVQHAPIMKELQDYTHDDNLMAILDPDGEVGPFPYFKWASTVRCSDAISSAIFSKFGIFRYRTFRNGTSANPMRSQVGMTSRWPIGVRFTVGTITRRSISKANGASCAKATPLAFASAGKAPPSTTPIGFASAIPAT